MNAETTAWSVGLIGLVGAMTGWALAPQAFSYAWLITLVTWFGWPLGAMGLLLIHALTGGGWGFAIRSQLASGIRALLFAPLMLVPFAATAPRLYPWLRADAPPLDNAAYLNGPFFTARGVVYLVIWLGLGWRIARVFRRDDVEFALARLAPAGLTLLALSVTFASIDAEMSLDPRFTSSVFGLVAIAEMGLLALAVCVFAAALVAPPEPQALRELGRLLLALAILWAYLDFMQLLIIWQSDLPREARWYSVRWSGGWGALAALVAAAHFALPFFLLLSSRAQGSRAVMTGAPVLLMAGALLRSFWLIAPAADATLKFMPLIVVAALAGVIGATTALALRWPLDKASKAWRHV